MGALSLWPLVPCILWMGLVSRTDLCSALLESGAGCVLRIRGGARRVRVLIRARGVGFAFALLGPLPLVGAGVLRRVSPPAGLSNTHPSKTPNKKILSAITSF